MSITRGNLYIAKREYHVFTTDDIGLNSLGLNSYNVSSIDRLQQSLPEVSGGSGNPFIQEVKSYFNTSIDTVLKDLICSGTYAPSGEPKIMHFDQGTLMYIEQKEADILKITEDCAANSPNLPTKIIKFLQAYNESLYSKDGLTSEGYAKKDIINVAKKVQNSLSGCITFSVKYKALGCERIVPIRLRLLDKENADDRRIVAIKGAPVIAGIPERITGGEYSFTGTENSPIGVYQNLNEGGIDNPKNTIAGQLDIRYNKTTGKWQSGTHQVLARLITDVDSAEVGATDNIAPVLDPASSNQVYNPNSNRYIGQFTTGSGIPLSMENGNPYMYGPNFIGCSGGARDVEKFKVVNRSNRIFKRGDVVLASQIDGEWIIQGFDLPTTTKKSLAGRWQFQKFIVNSDSFFKDGRFLSNNPANASPSYFLQNISPDAYETKMRKKYYVQAYSSAGRLPTYAFVESDLICGMNLFLDDTPEVAKTKPLPAKEEYDIELSTEYYQSSIFDQLDKSLGGTNDIGNVIGRTNIYASPDGQVGDEYGTVYQRQLPHFWGPTFPNGYTSKSVGSLIAKKDQKVKLKSNNENSHKFFKEQQELVLNTSKDKSVLGMFADSGDFNFLQLPAEIALNGPPISGLSNNIQFSAPIERINIITFDQENLPSYFYAKVSGQEKERYSYLRYIDSSGNKIPSGVFDLRPVNPGYIQFSPLQLHTALSSHEITNTFKFEYINLQNEIESAKSTQFFKQDYSSEKKLIFSNDFMERNQLDVEDEINFLNVQPAIGKGPFEFGPYVNFPEISSPPMGGPQIIPKETFLYERSNLIGIIAAKNSFSAGSEITIKTTQTFGLPRKVTVGTGGSVLVTVIGAFLAWNDANVPASQRGDPQWGDRTRTDAPDSFGTTALNVRIFDEWPDNQTFYDGRYFAILHFNPAAGGDSSVSEDEKDKLRCIYGSRFISAKRENTVLIATLYKTDNPSDGQVEKNIIETNVDFFEPTKLSNTIVSNNEIITSSTQMLPKEYWKINPVRRGALLTGGGFRYYKKVIGLDPSAVRIKTDPNNDNKPIDGAGYEKGNIIDFPKGAKVKVTSIGENGKITGIELIERGSDFLPEDFINPVTSYDTDGGAVIECTQGKVYYQYDIDLGPQQRCPIKKLSKPSDSGNGVATGQVKTVIPLDGNGKYDAFYFMHNDIMHTLLFETPFTAGLAQHITLEIG